MGDQKVLQFDTLSHKLIFYSGFVVQIKLAAFDLDLWPLTLTAMFVPFDKKSAYNPKTTGQILVQV